MQNDMQIHPSRPAASSFICFFPLLSFFSPPFFLFFSPLLLEYSRSWWEMFVLCTRPGMKRVGKKKTLHYTSSDRYRFPDGFMSISQDIGFHFCPWKIIQKPLPVYILPWQFFTGFGKHGEFIAGVPPTATTLPSQVVWNKQDLPGLPKVFLKPRATCSTKPSSGLLQEGKYGLESFTLLSAMLSLGSPEQVYAQPQFKNDGVCT